MAWEVLGDGPDLLRLFTLLRTVVTCKIIGLICGKTLGTVWLLWTSKFEMWVEFFFSPEAAMFFFSNLEVAALENYLDWFNFTQTFLLGLVFTTSALVDCPHRGRNISKRRI